MRSGIQRKAGYACARAFCAALALFALLILGANAESDGMLRVKLARLGSPAKLTMRADCDYVLEGDDGLRIPAGTDVTVSADDGVLTLSAGSHSVSLGESARLMREGSGHRGLAFTSPALSNRFCGDLNLTASGDTVAALLNIYIEDYLYGVVGYEMPPSSGIEALKAQAIVARNYALRQKQARSGAGYDLSDSGDALSFRGYNGASEYADALRAVDETRGRVVYYGDSPATCYFCDSNGGQTESSANAQGEGLPYSMVMDDPYDLQGGGAKKTASLRRDGSDLNEALRSTLVKGMADQLREQGLLADSGDTRITAIEAIEPVSPQFDAPSRLYRALAFSLSVSGKTLLGEDATARVKVSVPTYGALEQWYDLSINAADNETVWVSRGDQSFEITFRRKGSGMGMSQRGAMAMARKGLSCETILEYYYPGTRIREVKLSDQSGKSAGEAPKATATGQAIATARLKQKCRLYDSADDSAAARTTLPAGATVTVYAVQGEWAAIGSGKLYGFIHTDALASFALTGVSAAQVRNETYARVSGAVKVLQLPVSSAKAIHTLSDGELVRLNAYTDKWALIATTDGVEGFIARESLTLQAANAANSEASQGDDIVSAQDNLYGLVIQRAGLYVNTDDSVSPVKTLEKDARVRILAYNDTWASIRTADGETGFMKLAALSAVQEIAPVQEATPEGGEITRVKGKVFRYVSADALSLFKQCDTQSDILATLKLGDRVRVGAYNSKWACVRVNGNTGFVLISGLSETAPVAKGGAPEGGRIHRVKGARYAAVATDSAPLYPSWSEADAPITRLAKGTRVQIGAYNSVWAYVNVDNTLGYMRVDALAPAEADTEKNDGMIRLEGDAVVIADAAVYDNAELKGDALGTLPKGTPVRVHGYDQRCAYVEYNGHRGYVALSSLQKTD